MLEAGSGSRSDYIGDTKPRQEGLRQGYSLSPMVFQWVLPDVMETLRLSWTELGYGLGIAGRCLL